MIALVITCVADAYLFLFLARIALELGPLRRGNNFAGLVERLTEPMLRPIRRRVPPLRGLDFSPIVALLAIWFGERALRFLLS